MPIRELELLLDYLEEERAAIGFPGLAGSIVTADGVAWSGGFGIAELGRDRPVNADTTFHICSVSKLFAASLLQRIVQTGDVALDDPVSTHWSPIKMIAGAEAITLRQLVSHSSGLPTMPPLPEMGITDDIPTAATMAQIKMPTMARLIEVLPDIELGSRPGTTFNYSNVGIAILGQVLAEKLQLPYAEAVYQFVLQPLGMEDASFTITDKQRTNFATGHFGFADPPLPMPGYELGAFMAAGGLYASANEMARFLLGQMRPPAGYLTPADLESMWRVNLSFVEGRYDGEVVPAGIGLGWHISTIAGQKVVEHGGADPNYCAFLAYLPEVKKGVFLAANSGVNPEAIATMAHEVLEFLM